jgi:hypothetical protein
MREGGRSALKRLLSLYLFIFPDLRVAKMAKGAGRTESGWRRMDVITLPARFRILSPFLGADTDELEALGTSWILRGRS